MEYELKIGDTVFTESRYHGFGIRTVSRFTNTMIVLDDETKIRKPFTDYNTAIGTSGYGNIHYKPYSDELLKKYTRQQNLKLIGKFNFDRLNDDELKSLIDFLPK